MVVTAFGEGEAQPYTYSKYQFSESVGVVGWCRRGMLDNISKALVLRSKGLCLGNTIRRIVRIHRHLSSYFDYTFSAKLSYRPIALVKIPVFFLPLKQNTKRHINYALRCLPEYLDRHVSLVWRVVPDHSCQCLSINGHSTRPVALYTDLFQECWNHVS